VLAGLIGGLALGGGYLMVSAGRAILHPAPCEPAETSQCAFERDLAVQIARRQTLVGGALLLLALAIFSALRAKSSPSS
jgi:hypothetical protein